MFWCIKYDTYINEFLFYQLYLLRQFIWKIFDTCGSSAVLTDDEPDTSYSLDPPDQDDPPPGTRSHPTPPSQTPPASPLPRRVRAGASVH